MNPEATRATPPASTSIGSNANTSNHVYPFPQGFHDLRMNDQGVLGVLAGVGTAKAAASIMALGLDPRFDLSKAYWLVAGIAGADPDDASLGSAAWAEWVVDGDLAYEIDGREIPPEWTTGYVPLNKTVPYEQPRAGENASVFHLNPKLTDWAYQQTKAVKLDDSPRLAAARAHFAGTSARRPPFVLKGDTLSASTFWHGKLLDQWAKNWVRYQTDGQGNYVTSAMEDTGILQSLTFLHHAGRVDLDRVMVLRTVSNFDQPPIGLSAAESLKANAGAPLQRVSCRRSRLPTGWEMLSSPRLLQIGIATRTTYRAGNRSEEKATPRC